MSDASTELNANNSPPPSLQPPDKIAQIVGDLSGMELESKIGAIMDLIKTADLHTLKGVLEQLPTFLYEMPFTDICRSHMKTLLHVAVTYREYDVIEYLVNSMGYAKALREDNIPWQTNGLVANIIRDIHTIDEKGFEKKLKILKLLFTVRPELVESKEKNQNDSRDVCTPLLIATRRVFRNEKQMEFIKHLLLFKANPNVKDIHGWSPLSNLIRTSRYALNLKEMAKLLIENGADPRPANDYFRDDVDWFSKTKITS